MNIWVPKTKILEPRHELLLPGNRVSGRFRIEGRLDDGRRRVIAEWQPNLILDAGLERWGTDYILSHCCVGSDNTAPVVGDSALLSHVASTDIVITSMVAAGAEPYYGYLVFTATFSPPGADHNLSEIGCGWASGGGSLFSRALIKDSGGSPTTITWLAAETLIVTWEMRNYPWLTDAEVSTTISGDDYDLILRPAYVTSGVHWTFNPGQIRIDSYAHPSYGGYDASAHEGALGDITLPPAGTYVTGAWTSTPAYSAGTRKRTGTLAWDPTQANFAGGIPAVQISTGAGAYQIGFDPPIPKTDVDTLTLNLSTPVWGRYS
jgi:hypothetical protein